MILMRWSMPENGPSLVVHPQEMAAEVIVMAIAQRLLFHPIRDSRLGMDLSDLVDHPGVKKHAFGASGFTGVNMSSYSDIPGMFKNRWALTGISGRKIVRLESFEKSLGLTTSGGERRHGWPEPFCEFPRVF